MDLSVLLATHDRAASLERVLEGLHRQQLPQGLAWEVIVVESACTDTTPEVLRRWQDRLPLVALAEAAPGKYVAMNRGLERARGELLVFTDDDIVPADDWLAALSAAAGRWPDHDIFGGVVIPRYPPGTPAWMTEPPYAGVAFAHFDPGGVEGPSPQTPFGPNMAIRRSRVADLRYREDLGPKGRSYPIGGETELLRRLVAAGARAVHVPTARVEHVIRPDQVTEEFLRTRAYNYGRGQARLARPAPGSPRLFGAPRYLWRELAGAHLRRARTVLAGDPDARRRARWHLEVVRGHLREARAEGGSA
ncbi:MAG TPA: glycosyltransferase [Gemmatimonadales bacterium]|nr:glycosyltransferase [Gemmatimonadales bacterium]